MLLGDQFAGNGVMHVSAQISRNNSKDFITHDGRFNRLIEFKADVAPATTTKNFDLIALIRGNEISATRLPRNLVRLNECRRDPVGIPRAA